MDILTYCSKYKKVVCYGAGLYGKIVRVFLFEHNVDIEFFWVSKIIKERKKILEKSIYELSSFSYVKEEFAVLLCANERLRPDMERNLRERGITDYFVVDEGLVKQLDSINSYSNLFKTRGVQTLLYHRVAELENDIWKLAVTPENFEKQLIYLKENYHIVRFEEQWDDNAENTVSLTFDDGYFDNYENALPLLEKYGIPATIFVCIGNMDKDREFWWDELEHIIMCCEGQWMEVQLADEKIQLHHREDCIKACYYLREKILMMQPEERTIFLEELKRQTSFSHLPRKGYRTISREELKRLDKSPLITIGGHTVTHSKLTAESEGQQTWEISESKRVLENIIGHTITVFSYPFGSTEDYDKVTMDIAVKAGYEKIAAVVMKYAKEDLFDENIPRIGIQQALEGEDDLRSFRRTLCLNTC